MTIVYLHRGDRWCVLRCAYPGGRIGTLCLDSVDYDLVLIATDIPTLVCPACARELAAATPGAAVAVEPLTSERPTRDLRSPRDDAAAEWCVGVAVHNHTWTPIPEQCARYECECGATGYRGRGGDIVEHKQKLQRPARPSASGQAVYRGDGRVGRKPDEDWQSWDREDS